MEATAAERASSVIDMPFAGRLSAACSGGCKASRQGLGSAEGTARCAVSSGRVEHGEGDTASLGRDGGIVSGVIGMGMVAVGAGDEGTVVEVPRATAGCEAAPPVPWPPGDGESSMMCTTTCIALHSAT
jgi:hypothetical protein